MKKIAYLMFFVIFLSSLFGRIEALATKTLIPQFYGMYLLSEGKLIELAKNSKRSYVGDMMRGVAGIKHLSGIDIQDSNVNIIVYKERIHPSSIYLSKLKFVRQILTGGQPGNKFFPPKRYEANMWIAERSIKLRVAPIEEKKDMYRLVPFTPLSPGVYALHTGSLNNKTICLSI